MERQARHSNVGASIARNEANVCFNLSVVQTAQATLATCVRVPLANVRPAGRAHGFHYESGVRRRLRAWLRLSMNV